MKVFSTLFLVITFLAFFSCTEESYLYDETIEISDNTWRYEDSISFELPISDTTAVYQLLLDVSHGRDYPYENFYTEISTHFPDGKVTKDIISLELINDFGYSRGSCNSSECTVPINLLKSVKFESAGTYTIVFKQHTRNSRLKDIHKLRMMVKVLDKTQ